MVAAACSVFSWPRPLTTTAAPDRASSVAIASPIPWLEPETSARRPVRSIFIRAGRSGQDRVDVTAVHADRTTGGGGGVGGAQVHDQVADLGRFDQALDQRVRAV